MSSRLNPPSLSKWFWKCLLSCAAIPQSRHSRNDHWMSFKRCCLNPVSPCKRSRCMPSERQNPRTMKKHSNALRRSHQHLETRCFSFLGVTDLFVRQFVDDQKTIDHSILPRYFDITSEGVRNARQLGESISAGG